MTVSEEEYILNLRYFHQNSFLPLKKGNNLILSNFFPEFATDNIILFNLNILSKNEASLRTFDYFPLMINFCNEHSHHIISNPGIEKEVLIKKQSIIFINSLLTIHIVPLSTKNSNIGNKFFFFEKYRKGDINKRYISKGDETSKNIIYHLERKKDISEMSEKESDSNVNLNIEEQEKNKRIINPKIGFKNENINPNERIGQSESNLIAKDEIINFDLKKNKSPDENYCSVNSEKSDDSMASQLRKSEMIKLSEGNSDNLETKLAKQDNIDREISEKIKSNNEVTNIVETPTEMMQSKTPNSINSNNYMKDKFNQDQASHNSPYNIQSEAFLPRKILIIDDDIISNEGLEPPSVSIDSLINTSSTAPRNTRSSSKSVNNSNIELLEKKRKRQEQNPDTKININKENSNINDNLANHLATVNKNRDSNLNINDTVNSFPKHYVREYKEIKFGNPIQNNISENVKKIISPELEQLETLKQKCTICLDIINNVSRLDKCEHEFCKECIDQWAILSNECPLCKVEFKKIIYWESDNRQVMKVKKRKFKFDEEEDEPWVRNCAEHCMVCNKSNDEHLLLVCDRCSFNICHTYCAGLDIIPADDWLCSACTNRRGRRKEIPLSLSSVSCNVEDTGNNYIKRKTLIVDDDDEEIPVKNNSIVSNSNNNKNSKNINIPISYKLSQDQVNRNSLHLNPSLNLNISNDQGNRKKKGKLVRRSLSAAKPLKLTSKFVNQNEKIQTRRKYNLRKKK